MGMFDTILSKLGFGKAQAAETSGTTAPAPGPVPAATPVPQATPSAVSASAPAAASVSPATIRVVDVVSQLEEMAATHAEKLNWRVSIVDLMKLLGLDSSFAVRKEMATELGCPAEKMGDSAQMNMWLHKTVLQKLADNGGNIPADLLK